MTVVLYHSILFYGPDLAGIMIMTPQQLSGLRDVVAWTVLAMFNGAFAVTLFFILSGLVLAQSLQHSAAASITRLCAAFLVRRILRLMPPLVVGVLFSFVVGHMLAWLGLSTLWRRSWSELWANVALLDFKVNGATWTIQVEIIAAPVLFAIYGLMRMIGPVFLFVVLAAAIYIVPLPGLFGSRLLYLNDALFAFAVGILVAQPWAKQAFASRHGVTAWLLLAAFVFSRPVLGWGNHVAVVTQILIGGALIGNLTASRSGLSDILDARVSQFLGRISYSFYLLNVPVIWIVVSILPMKVGSAHALEAGLLAFAATTLLTIPLAILSMKVVEDPGISIGRRLARPLLGLAPPAQR